MRRRVEEGGLAPPEPEVLLRELDVVTDLVEAALAGGTPDLPRPAEGDLAGLVDLLRATALAEWPDGAAGLLQTMRALEAVRSMVAGDPASGVLPRGVLTPYGHRLLREVAHTLRSPLGSIVMLAETLQEGRTGDLSDQQRDQLRIIHRASLSIAALASDLLVLTREEDEIGGEPVPFSVADLVQQVADLVRPTTHQRGVELEVEVPEDAHRVGHPGPLRRALLNIALQTAIRVRRGRVLLAAREDDDGDMVYSVEGPAGDVSPDEVFAAFRQAEEGGGYSMSASALGMGVARHLVRRLGSDVVAERAPEDTLRISFRLPHGP